MKKKIINGILMVALLAATTTSFVSCKDNSEDVKTDLVAALNKQAGDLEEKWKAADQALETSLKNWVAEQGYATKAQLADSIKDVKAWVEKNYVTHDSLNSYKNEVAAQFVEVGKRIDTLGLKIDTLKADVAQLKLDVDTLKNRMDAAEDSIDVLRQDITNIVETLKKMVTSVTVNATSTNILANSKVIPGINMQFLGATMGQAEGNGEFPSAEAGDYVSGHGVVLTAADIKDAEKITWNDKDYLPVAKAGKAPAGTLYFTLNPSNVTPKSLLAKNGLSLVNSQNKASFITFDMDSVKESKEVLTWGITRAEYTPTLWEVPAIIDLKATDLATIETTKVIDFKGIASDVRAMLSEVKQAAIDANRSNYEEKAKETTKSLIKGSAQIVAELLQAKIPALPALALKATWADTVGTRSVLSDYSIAATAYKPLSFTWGNDLIDGRTISLDRIDNAVARLINKIENKIKSIDLTKITVSAINISDLDAAKLTKKLYLYYNNAGAGNIVFSATKLTTMPTGTNAEVEIAVDMTDGITEMLNTVNTKMSLNELSSLINQIKQIQNDAISYADRSINFEKRVSDFLEREINRVITKVSTDGLTRVLEPIILFQQNENYAVSRFFDGTTIAAGKVVLIPTTMTYELLAPAYKKYVAVKKADGSFAFQKVLTKGDKDFSKVTVDLAAGNYEVIYSAVDFSGKQIAKKYNITVK